MELPVQCREPPQQQGNQGSMEAAATQKARRARQDLHLSIYALVPPCRCDGPFFYSTVYTPSCFKIRRDLLLSNGVWCPFHSLPLLTELWELEENRLLESIVRLDPSDFYSSSSRDSNSRCDSSSSSLSISLPSSNSFQSTSSSPSFHAVQCALVREHIELLGLLCLVDPQLSG